eukprot:CAMPEP_0115828452 /NCGR_PEP_ID=MMETSP0287-20121206/580_1 /TAXON_ID=412157 /ORGANISM="Chrysochromulina rotalis, Strain UIO044" /LENGTH=115 /DNA_ID=CAMNT_0003281667 /DNA_START=788 /DNA_END=1135 /DNA_ORIENTATION=-
MTIRARASITTLPLTSHFVSQTQGCVTAVTSVYGVLPLMGIHLTDVPTISATADLAAVTDFTASDPSGASWAHATRREAASREASCAPSASEAGINPFQCTKVMSSESAVIMGTS